MPSCSPRGPMSPFGPGSPTEPLSPLGPAGPRDPGIPIRPAGPGKPVAAEEMVINLARGPGGASTLTFLQGSTGCRHSTSTLLNPGVILDMGVHIPILQIRKRVCQS